MKLKWNADTPKEPGWYWYQVRLAPYSRRILYVYRHYKGFLARSSYPTDEVPVDCLDCLWAGPIPEPLEEQNDCQSTETRP